MRLRRRHGFIIPGSVKAFDIVLFGEGTPDFEGTVEAGLVATFSFASAI